MAEHNSILDTLETVLVPVHRDGHKFVAIGAIATLLLFLLWAPLGWIAAIITLWIVYFFRDPERVTQTREGLVIAPADGRITAIEEVMPPKELALGDEPLVRVSTFLSIFDVHIQRAPVAGDVKEVAYTPGLFLNAVLDKASEDNERNGIVIETPKGDKIGVVQIAGLIARRILCFVKAGEQLGVGERYGLIRFGSRVDVYLPKGKTALVSVGQKAIGGETVFADLRSDEEVREARAQ
ncbi:MAG: phosphatidylserine decarboxylase proenzyme [Rhodomicrobium sp.]|nr:MAG: phosphatidylserine decarboxylase proenzyme [Rhodomicrobium sp.]